MVIVCDIPSPKSITRPVVVSSLVTGVRIGRYVHEIHTSGGQISQTSQRSTRQPHSPAATASVGQGGGRGVGRIDQPIDQDLKTLESSTDARGTCTKVNNPADSRHHLSTQQPSLEVCNVIWWPKQGSRTSPQCPRGPNRGENAVGREA